ncbi:MAG: methyltransferase domain-containing protein [Tepidisphaeraceae bacterium]|jgi:SAM-dependent methyltransferase
MGESDGGQTQTAIRESKYFDSVVTEQGDFNPFADRGWMTLRKQFEKRVVIPSGWTRGAETGESLKPSPGTPGEGWGEGPPAKIQDPHPSPLPEYRARGEEQASRQGMRLLEIGCGTGQSWRIYEGFTSRHIGIDLSEAALRVATINFPKAVWMRQDACRLGFADETFDVVAFSSVLHHIPNYTDALKEAARVLKPGGRVFAFDPNLLHPAMMIFRWPRSPLYIAEGVSPNERPLLASELRRAFDAAGFDGIETRGQAHIPYRHVAPKLMNGLLSVYNAADAMLDYSGLGKWIGTFNITTARKPLGTPAIRTDGVPRYSVVVPVFNESEMIGEYCRHAVTYLPPNYELLIVYDFPEDTTLAALAALPGEAKPANIRLIHNTLGRGVRFAIDAGMRAAKADVVVVMMADVSDDFAKVPRMIELAESGADVVCASRYMRGGRQIGGPMVKGFLSRMAGITLHWLAGVPTHDPTNSFKAYRRDFLQKTPIQSTAGFCLGMELTVKAHFNGGRVEEVPATWRDRTAGQSRFKLFKWLPAYLHWYWWALRRRWISSRS